MMRAVALTFAMLATAAGAAPGGADLEAAAMKTAQTLGGVLRDCPASFAQIGTPEKRCVGAGEGVEDARLKLNRALPKDLYGVWRSRDEQRSVYNWLRTAGGYVYLRLQPDPDGRAQTLVYLDLPPAQTGQPGQTAGPNGNSPASTTSAQSTSAGSTQIDSVTLTPAAPASAAPEASPSAPAASVKTTTPPAATQPGETSPPTSPASTPETPAPNAAVPAPTPDLAPVPFSRALSVQNRRLNGPDVLAVQNRLIALMRPRRAGQGDGWYGPVTAQTVRVFQKASGLPATGVVDRVTWNRLFSGAAGDFAAPTTP